MNRTYFVTPSKARQIVKRRFGIEHDIEGCQLSNGQWISYVNRGDPYRETLVTYDSFYDLDESNQDRIEWFWACWGDLEEEAEIQADEEEEI